MRRTYIMQWRQVARVGWWIAILIVSSITASTAGSLIGRLIGSTWPLETISLVLNFSITTLYAALTGTGLVFLLAQPKPADPAPTAP